MEEPPKKNSWWSKTRPAEWLGGCSAIGLLLTGVAGLLTTAVFAISNTIAAAVALVASALAFGFIMTAMYRR